MGTVPYMSPEQVQGGALDHRTDIFSLGVILHEMATGRRPFQGRSSADLLAAILRDAVPPVTASRPDLPAHLARAIRRCLEKDKGQRFQAARDLAAELRSTRTVADEDVSRILRPPPVPSTPLIGREETLEAAAERLRSGARLLTITGYGGTGKTRFAIELFDRHASGHAGGAAFVSLASVTAAADVLPTLATALAIPEAQGRSALDALATVVGSRDVLLVLDNLEQVLDAAEDVAALVARCPRLRVIATSRAPLKVGAETEFSLPPLELPAAGAQALDVLRRCPSVSLFVQRAAKVKPGFALCEANAAPIAEICRRLDGLPLALELAAARARILEPAALLQRLDHALDLLTSGDRDLPLRQRTLRAAISWSYSLLDAQEQRLLRRLSCFHEGWTLEAMEQVCYAADERPRALDELDSLVEKGLVRVVGRVRALRAPRDGPRLRRRAAPRERRGGDDAARPRGPLRRVRGASRLRPPHSGPDRGHAARPPRGRQLARGDRLAHRARARRRRRGAGAGAPAVRPPGLVLAHQRPAPDRARGLRDPAGARRRRGRRAAAARSRGSGPAWSRPRPTSGSARSASGPAASRTARPWGTRGSRPRAGWAWATAT